jgi:hypothetical protein
MQECIMQEFSGKRLIGFQRPGKCIPEENALQSSRLHIQDIAQPYFTGKFKEQPVILYTDRDGFYRVPGIIAMRTIQRYRRNCPLSLLVLSLSLLNANLSNQTFRK